MSKHVFGFERWEQWVTDKATALLEAGRTGSLRRVLCSRSVPRTVLSCPFYGVTPRTSSQALAPSLAPAAPIETDRSLRWKSLGAALV